MAVVTTLHTESTDKPANLVADLFDRYYLSIYAYLYRLVNNQELASDLAQETFLRLHRTRHRLAQVENERAWVYRIATNLAFDTLKRQRRFSWLPWGKVDTSHLAESDPAELFDKHTAVKEALAELSPLYRAPFLLYSYYGFNISEIAESLNISEGAVKTRLHRARSQFRQAYQRGNQ